MWELKRFSHAAFTWLNDLALMKGQRCYGRPGYTIGTRTNKRITRGGLDVALARQNFLSISDNASFFPLSRFSFCRAVSFSLTREKKRRGNRISFERNIRNGMNFEYLERYYE